MRDEQFDKYGPRIPQGKVWQVKAADQPTGPVGPLQSTGLTGVPDRSDRLFVFLNDHRVIRKRTEDTVVALHPESIQGIEISLGTDVQ